MIYQDEIRKMKQSKEKAQAETAEAKGTFPAEAAGRKQQDGGGAEEASGGKKHAGCGSPKEIRRRTEKDPGRAPKLQEKIKNETEKEAAGDETDR